jgi:hypothetical protein
MKPLDPISLDRMVNAVERVRDRMLRAAAALEKAAVPYAVVGGNAVAAWVSRVDVAAVRNTQDVDVLIRRTDLELAKEAMAAAGFVFRHVKGIDMFLDGPNAKARDAVHLIFAGEKVGRDDEMPAPDVTESASASEPPLCVIGLEPLVRMKLTAHRLKDQVHLQDLIGVGLIDATWPHRFPRLLAERLQRVLDNPEA